MPRHSKNNTNASFLTYSEKQKLEYGTIKKRVGSDSLKPFDSCYLCLKPAREPLSCDKGHLSCKECIYENILAQKIEIEKYKNLIEHKQRQSKLEEEEDKLREKEEMEKEFIKSQTSILPPKASLYQQNSFKKVKLDESTNTALIPATLDSNGDGKGYNKELKPIESKKISSFWVPSLTPSVEPEAIQNYPTQPLCTLGDHPINLKKLIPLHFSYPKDSKKVESHEEHKKPRCPCCLKTLTNALKLLCVYLSSFGSIFRVVSKKCGHVICSHCYDTAMSHEQDESTRQKNHCCFVCQTDFGTDDIIYLSRDGTGYAGGGGNVLITKFDIAFQ